ncbi:hypothetical protein [Methanosarcina acetivorans]|nr:hypothetical protein [Methanosarcina acetivorans]
MGYYIVRIHASTWDLLRDLQRLHDLDVFSKTAKQLDDCLFEIHGLLSDEQIENLSKKGYQIEIIANAAEVAKGRKKGVPCLSLSPGDQSGQE